MAGNSRFDHLRAPKGNKKSSPGDNRLGYSRVTESVDERALSSASTPINNPPYGAGKSSLAMGRHSVPDMTYGNELASALPRRFSNNGSASNFPSPVNARPSASRAAGGGRTPTRDENEAPSNGARGGMRPGSGALGTPGSKLLTTSSPLRGSPSNQNAFQLGTAYPVIPNRLSWASVRTEPAQGEGEHWFMTDRVLIYSAFCADFGPMNLSAVHRFCKIMKEKMENKDLAKKKLVYFTGATPQLRTNCVFLLGCYLCTELGMSPEEAWQCFGKFEPSPFMGYRDATFVRSTWDLSIIDCWRGLLKGIKSGLINFATFNPDEYDYYDHPQHGDMHVMVPGKFIAFKGPTGRRYRLAPGLFSHTPKDYVEVFRHHKVSAIVRLNSKEYDKADFVKNGLNHYDLFFEDCTTPTEALVQRFMDVADKEKGLTAVHCLAGLGRTGTLIGLWIMKKYDFSAAEVIAYLRIMRPGSIIGPQQQYLCAAASRLDNSSGARQSFDTAGIANSAALAKEVREGMLRRHVHRDETVAPAWNTPNGKNDSGRLGKGS